MACCPDNGARFRRIEADGRERNSEHRNVCHVCLMLSAKVTVADIPLRAPGVGFSSRARTRNALHASTVAPISMIPPFHDGVLKTGQRRGDGFSIADRGNELLRYEHDNFQSVLPPDFINRLSR